VRGAVEVAIAGDPADAAFGTLAGVVANRYLPSLVLAGGRGKAVKGIALLAGREADEPTAYVCRAYACERPTSEPVELAEQLKAVSGQLG
jgi:uncharacterized protein YyaL (SSP411 family)